MQKNTEQAEDNFYGNLSYVCKLKNIMKILRSERGCPWDREQTHTSLIPYLMEETYEVASAIEENSPGEICEEPGFFHQIGEKEGTFTFEDAAKNIVEKLIRRHPHVFSTTEVSGSDEVVKNWEEIKKKERKNSGTGRRRESLLDSVPGNLPALIEATLLGKKAATAGFDWARAEDIMAKIHEEIKELEGAVKEKKFSHIREEIGDVLFSVVNLSRHLNIDAEYALRTTSQKFIRRFKRIEEFALEEGISLKGKSLEELDKLWDRAKEEEGYET